MNIRSSHMLDTRGGPQCGNVADCYFTNSDTFVYCLYCVKVSNQNMLYMYSKRDIIYRYVKIKYSIINY